MARAALGKALKLASDAGREYLIARGIEPLFEPREGRALNSQERSEVSSILRRLAAGEAITAAIIDSAVTNPNLRAILRALIDSFSDQVRAIATTQGPEEASVFVRDFFFRKVAELTDKTKNTGNFHAVVVGLADDAWLVLRDRELLMSRAPKMYQAWQAAREQIFNARELERLLRVTRTAEVEGDLPEPWRTELVAHPQLWDCAAMVLTLLRFLGTKESPKAPGGLSDALKDPKAALAILGSELTTGGGQLLGRLDVGVVKAADAAVAALEPPTPPTTQPGASPTVQDEKKEPSLAPFIVIGLFAAAAIIAAWAAGC